MAAKAVVRLLAGAGAVCACAAAGEAEDWGLEQLERIERGEVGKDELEIVLAQHKEDVAWSDRYKHVRTVYCKGGASCQQDTVKLVNVGREAHTFLHHIVSNYDNLAKWTVFSQAEEPTEGYMGQGFGGGHMLAGASFEDYVLHPQRPEREDPDAFFLMTQKMHLPTLQHAVRSTYKIHADQQVQHAGALPQMCPLSRHDVEGDAADAWQPFRDMSWLRRFLSEKCSVTEDGLKEAVDIFWESHVALPHPPANVVHFAQGARFAVSRERIQQRPLAFYEELLGTVSHEVDPCLSYMLEWAWWYIVGKPEGVPCRLTRKPEVVPWLRKLQTDPAKGDKDQERDDELDDDWQAVESSFGSSGVSGSMKAFSSASGIFSSASGIFSGASGISGFPRCGKIPKATAERIRAVPCPK